MGRPGWESQAGVERYMADWISTHWAKTPAESMIRRHVVETIEKFEKGRKGR